MQASVLDFLKGLVIQDFTMTKIMKSGQWNLENISESLTFKPHCPYFNDLSVILISDSDYTT